MKVFKSPNESLGQLDAGVASKLITAAADVALVIDSEGIIVDLSFQQPDLALELQDSGNWIGRAWIETVEAESRSKIVEILQQASEGLVSRWRQVHFSSARATDIPIMFTAVSIGGQRCVAIGRDMRVVAKIQQRLVEAQISMERDYSRLRHVETRYRMLFQSSFEPVLMVDSTSLKISDANPAAGELLRTEPSRLIGKLFPEGINVDNLDTLQSMATSMRSGGRSPNIESTVLIDGRMYSVSAALFWQESARFYLVRFAPENNLPSLQLQIREETKLAGFFSLGPDAFVLTDEDGVIASANSTFTEMAQLVEPSQAQGETLDRWLGRPGVDLGVLISGLRQHGTVRLFATQVRGEYGAVIDVEISAVTVADGGRKAYGFAIRNVGRRLAPQPKPSRELPHSIAQLTELVGRVPLRDLVRETADVIEKMCIEAALELTHGNRASAAEMLGLSRQSLYVKLRRFGMLEPAENEEQP